MQIVQKKGSTTHTFTFFEDYFNFAYKDKSGSGDLDIRYSVFTQKHSIQIEHNDWVRNIGILWIMVGLVQLFADLSADPARIQGNLIPIGLLCLWWAHRSKIVNAVYQTQDGNVFIIQDTKYTQIVDEIMQRRKTALLALYGDINFDNELEHEKAKFNWLVEEGVISQDEANQKIAQLELSSNTGAFSSSIQIN